MEEEMGELNIKVALREERDRLLEILRVLPQEATEAKRLIEVRLATIKESLEN
jgi:hypothetical protein